MCKCINREGEIGGTWSMQLEFIYIYLLSEFQSICVSALIKTRLIPLI